MTVSASASVQCTYFNLLDCVCLEVNIVILILSTYLSNTLLIICILLPPGNPIVLSALKNVEHMTVSYFNLDDIFKKMVIYKCTFDSFGFCLNIDCHKYRAIWVKYLLKTKYIVT